MTGVPMIRIRVDGLGEEIAGALALYHHELAESIRSATIKAVSEFDFAAEVDRQVRDAIRESIRGYFSPFGGGKHLIEDAVQAALAKGIDDKRKLTEEATK